VEDGIVGHAIESRTSTVCGTIWQHFFAAILTQKFLLRYSYRRVEFVSEFGWSSSGACTKFDSENDGTFYFEWQMKTGWVALCLCLNIGVDPPDVIKISPYARLECWTGNQYALHLLSLWKVSLCSNTWCVTIFETIFW
jgi:hypothetical protein